MRERALKIVIVSVGCCLWQDFILSPCTYGSLETNRPVTR